MDLLLISGVSGSGKSVALAALEDSGWYAVNNLPLPLLAETAAYLERAGQTRVAIGLDIKTEPGLAALPAMIARLRAAGRSVRFVYFDARTDTLVKRFSETRRRHPFSSDTRTLTEAIEFERELLADVRPLALAFDTSETSAATLRSWIKSYISVDATRLTVLLESFGFKHGVPLDADLVFDVRCLPNPHYEPLLQPLDGARRPGHRVPRIDARRRADVRRHPPVRRRLAARLRARQSQLPDGGHRLHRRQTPLGLPGRAARARVRPRITRCRCATASSASDAIAPACSRRPPIDGASPSSRCTRCCTREGSCRSRSSSSATST